MGTIDHRAPLHLDESGLDALIASLRTDGYTVIGPTVRDGAIVGASVRGIADLPRGVGDEQSPGRYRLRARGDDAFFGHVVGPHAPKREFLVPVAELFRARRSGASITIEAAIPPARRVALLGVRACELAAMAIQDRVLRGGPHVDVDYAARREDVFVVAVQCGAPASTCFCTSMDTGPRAHAGFDLALTELLDGGHRFVVEIGSDRGARSMARLGAVPATDADLRRAEAVVDATARTIDRRMEPDAAALLARNLEHPRWDDVAARCIGCGNCTMVCPTCVCTTVNDSTSLDGSESVRTRHWDSCFTPDFAYVHGGSVRSSIRARYRQWLTHKLSTWHEQFGSSGCVGCGRCITHCPVGIDITAEVAAIAATEPGPTS